MLLLKNIRISCLLVCLLGLISNFVAASNQDITINYNHISQQLTVEQCFDSAPDFIESKNRQIIQMTSGMHWQDESINFRRGYAELPDGQSGCVSYVINAKNHSDSRRLKQQHSDSLLLTIDQFLWQTRNEQLPYPKVIINHSKGVQISAPWRLIKREKQQTIYQVQPSPKYSNGYVAFGALSQKEVMLGDSKLRLSIMQGEFLDKTELISKWIETMAGSVAQVGEGFPVKEAQVLVILTAGNRGAVPWGQVNRDGGSGVLFVVNANKSAQQLFADWTAAHEFSHLLTPYTASDRWLSEGFASYHQNISRLRAGILDEETAWSKLVAGFERGRKSAASASAPILKNANRRHNMQMYWGGAVIALKADVALQQASNGQMSLSKALSGLQNCCLETGEDWSARKLFSQLDKITDSNVFMTLYKKDVVRKSYPEYQSILNQLGVEQTQHAGLKLNNQAPMAEIRKRMGNI